MKFASLLTTEMTRVAKRATKTDIAVLTKKISAQRREISALKAQVAEISKKMTSVGHKLRGAPAPVSGIESGVKRRFRLQGFLAMRKKLGLTQAQLAQLIGVSPITIFKWESGTVRPRVSMLSKIATVRKLGKRGVNAMLAKGQSTQTPTE